MELDGSTFDSNATNLTFNLEYDKYKANFVISPIITHRTCMKRYQKMVRDLVSDIKLLNRVNVHIKDKTRVNELLGKIVEGGFKQLQIVSDFDQTITKQHENGKKHLSSFGESILKGYQIYHW